LRFELAVQGSGDVNSRSHGLLLHERDYATNAINMEQAGFGPKCGGLEKLNRRFAIRQKNQLNPFASCKIATISVFCTCLVFVRFAPVLVTGW
jgi:hypothetical protein